MSMGSVAARRARIVNCCERGLNFTIGNNLPGMIGALIVNAFQGSLTRIPVKDMALRVAHFSESPRICRCAKGEPKGFELGDRPGWSNHQRVIIGNHLRGMIGA